MKTLDEFKTLLDRFAIEISEGWDGKKEERELTEAYEDVLDALEECDAEYL